MSGDKIEIGDSFQHPYHREYLCHVRGFVDDQLVVRYWRKGKQRWEYALLSDDEVRRFVVVIKAAKKGKSCTPSKS